MAVTIWFRKLYDKVIPLNEESAELLYSLKMNGEYKAEFTQPRNAGFHRKFFGLINKMYKNYEQPEVYYQGQRVYKSQNKFRDEIIIGCGYWELGLDKKNNVIRTAKSISFANMDQTEFEVLFSKAIDVILADYVPHYKGEDMDRLVEEILRFG